MNEKRSMGMFVPFNIDIMTYEPLKEVVDEEGTVGLAAVAALLLHLIQFPGGVTKLGDVNYVGAQIHKKGTFVRHIVKDYRMFRVTPDGQSFYSPYLREILRLKPDVETADDVGRRMEVNGEKTKKRVRYVPVAINFMTYEEVTEIIREEGANGLGIVLALLVRLLQFKGGIAELDDVNIVATQLHKRADIVRRIITDYSMFRLTPDGQSYYSPYLRNVMKLEPEIRTENDYHKRAIVQPTCNQCGISVETKKNGSADNQAVSAPSIDINIKDKKDINIKTPSTTTKKIKKKEEKKEFFYEKNNFYNAIAKERLHGECPDGEPSYSDRESVREEHSYGESSYSDRESVRDEHFYGESSYTGRESSYGEQSYSGRESVHREYSDGEPNFGAIVSRLGVGRGEPPTGSRPQDEEANERRYEEARRRLPEKVDRMFADAEWLRNIYEQGHTPLCWQKGQSTPESFAHCIVHIKRWFVQQVVCKGNPADSPQRLRYYFFNLMNPGSRTREECRRYVSDLLQRERSLAAEGKPSNDGYGYEY